MDIKNTKDGCIDGFDRHSYNKQGVCIRCGVESKNRGQYIRRNLNPTAAKRPTPEISRKDAQDGITMIILAAQTVVLTARPDLKEDALNPQERALLADALTEEAFQSVTVKRWLTKVGQQQKHAKLVMVLTAIAIPRLARRGFFPADSAGEMSGELITQASKTTGFSGDSPTGSETEWESVPVESGGSPFTNRGNGIGQNDFGGVVAETAPFRGGVTDESRRSEVSNGRDSEIPSLHVEPEIEPDRIKTGSHSSRPKKS
jgi:hypothetical protein